MSQPPGQEPQPGQPGQPVPPQGQSPQQGYQYPQQAQPAWQPPAAPRERAGWGGTLGLLAVLLFVTLGGFLFGGSSGAVAGDVELGEPVAVTENVSIRLAEGWSVLQPSQEPPGVVLGGAGGNALVGVPPGSGPPEALLEFYVNQILGPQADQLTVGEAEPLELASGSALVASYVGVFPDVSAPLEGQVVAVVAPTGVGVVVDGWASQGTYVGIQDQVLAMADSVVTA